MNAVLFFFIVPETSGASIKVLEDNEGAKALINNPLELSFHFIRDLFRKLKTSVEYVASAE